MILTFDQAFGQGGAATAAASPESFSAPVSEPAVTQAASPQPQAQAPQQPQIVPFDQAFGASPQQTADTQMGGTTQPTGGVPAGQPAPQGQTPTASPQPQSPDPLSVASQANGYLQKAGSIVNQFSPGATTNLGGTGANLSDVGGPLSLATGIEHGNVGQAVGGAISTLGAAGRVAGNLFDSPGLTEAGNDIGALGGPLSLAMGIKSGDPVGIISGALSTYNAVNTLVTSLGGEALPSAATTLASIAPETAAAIANTFSTGVTVAADAGAEAIGAALSASLSLVGAAAAPIIMGVMAYISTQEAKQARESGQVNNPIAAAMYTNAVSGVTNSQKITDQIAAAGGPDKVSTDVLSQALPSQLNNLLAYYQSTQGPAGPITASAAINGMFGRKGLGGAGQYTANFTKAQQGFTDSLQSLMKRGMSYEDIGKLPVSNSWTDIGNDMYNPLQDFYTKQQSKFDTEGAQIIQKMMGAATSTPGMNSVQVGEGDTMVADGTVSHSLFGNTIDPAYLTADVLFDAAQGAAFYGAPDSVSKAGGLTAAMYGGPLWAAVARMGNSVGGQQMQDMVAQKFDPWALARTWTPQQLWDAVKPIYDQRLAEAAKRQQAFTSGGGDAGATGTGPAGQGAGTAGTAAGVGNGPGGAW